MQYFKIILIAASTKTTFKYDVTNNRRNGAVQDDREGVARFAGRRNFSEEGPTSAEGHFQHE